MKWKPILLCMISLTSLNLIAESDISLLGGYSYSGFQDRILSPNTFSGHGFGILLRTNFRWQRLKTRINLNG